MVHRVRDWLVEPEHNRVSRGNEIRSLEPKAMDVLVCLLAHMGEVVSREDILREVWGDRAVEPGSVTQKIAAIRRALGSDGRKAVRWISKRGYCIPRDQMRDDVVGRKVDAPTQATDAAHGGRNIAVETPVVVGTDDFREFALIVEDDLRQQLAKKSVSVDVAASTTGARFSMGLRIRLANDVVRISFAIESTSKGSIVWSSSVAQRADSLDEFRAAEFVARLAEDVVAFQTWCDQLAAKGRDPAAIDEFFQGSLYFQEQATTGSTNYLAMANHLERALEIDPGVIPARTLLVYCYCHRMGESLSVDECREKAHAHLQAALATTVNGHLAHALAQVNGLDGDYDAAFVNLDYAKRHGAELGLVEQNRSWIYFAKGMLDEAITCMRTSVDHGVRAAQMENLIELGRLHISAGRYEEALDWLAEAQQCGGEERGYLHLHAGRAWAYLDNETEASRSIEKAVRLGDPRLGTFASGMALIGRQTEARALVDECTAKWNGNVRLDGFARGAWEVAESLAEACIHLGDIEGAFRWLPGAKAGVLRCAKWLDGIRGSEAFVDLMRDIEAREAYRSPTRIPGLKYD